MTDVGFVEAAGRIGYEGGRSVAAQVTSALQAIEKPGELAATLWSIRTAVLACGANLPESFGHSPSTRAQSHHLLALLAVRSGAMQQAVAHFQEGRALASTLPDPSVLAELELDFCSWVRPEVRLGLADEIANVLTRLTSQTSATDDLWRGRLALARGRFELFRGELDSARVLLCEAERECEKTGFLHGRGRARLLLASVYEQFEGDIAGLLESAHNDALAGGDRHLAVLTGLSWTTCIASRDVRAAAEMLEWLLPLVGHASAHSWAASVHVLAGQIHMALGRAEQANVELVRSLEIIREHRLSPGQALLVPPLSHLLLREQDGGLLRRGLLETVTAWLQVAGTDRLPFVEAPAAIAAQALGVKPDPPELEQRLVRLEQARFERDAGVLRALGYEGQTTEDRRRELAHAKATFARFGDEEALAHVQLLRAAIPGDLDERRAHATAARESFLATHNECGVLLADLQLATLALERDRSAREQLLALAPRLEALRLTRELGELYFWLSTSYMLFSPKRRTFMGQAADAWANSGMGASEIRNRIAPLTLSKWEIFRAVLALVLFLLAWWGITRLGSPK